MQRWTSNGLPGPSFSRQRARGLSGAMASLARTTGVPLTAPGNERKRGRAALRALPGGVFRGRH